MAESKTYLMERNYITFVVRRTDLYKIGVEDVGRCYRLHYPNHEGSVDVAKGACSSFDALVRKVRRDILTNNLPILDVHATGRYC